MHAYEWNSYFEGFDQICHTSRGGEEKIIMYSYSCMHINGIHILKDLIKICHTSHEGETRHIVLGK